MPASYITHPKKYLILVSLKIGFTFLNLHKEPLRTNKVLKTWHRIWDSQQIATILISLLHLLRKRILQHRERNVSRMHAIAQSCCVGLAVSFFPSLHELHNQASWERESEQRNVYTGHVGKIFQMWHVSINDTQWVGGDWCSGGGRWVGGVGWGVGTIDRLSVWMRISLRERQKI